MASAAEHGGAGPAGTKVRGSRWPGWWNATGRSYGPPTLAGSGWTRASGRTGSTFDAPCAALGANLDPSSESPPVSGTLSRLPR